MRLRWRTSPPPPPHIPINVCMGGGGGGGQEHSTYPVWVTLKTVFHWIARLRWVPNATKNKTNNMKSTWPMPAPRIGDPMRPIFQLLTLGVCVRGNANFRVRVGGNANFGFLDTNMLVSPMRNCGIGGLSQREDPTRVVLRPVEYRL